jgi:ornithine cyclodeaminase/alanine dehydrogenase-like protein (mu-crystallin family)
MFRGSEIHHVDIVNRSFARAQALMQEIYTSPEWQDLRNANPKLAFSSVSSEYGEYQRLVKENVRKADVIFLCTPSTSPLFPHEYLTSSEGRKKGRYISAIGSYRPHMVEVHPEIFRQAVAPDHKHHHHKHADKGGVIVVDSLEACLKEAGEVIQAGISAEQLVEVGELLMVKKASMKEIEMGTGPGEKGLRDWLMKGNVIYKSVGIGLMDICVGEDLVALAMEKGVGTSVDGW